MLELISQFTNNILSLLVIETRIASTFSILFFLRKGWIPTRIILMFSLVITYFVMQSTVIDIPAHYLEIILQLMQQFFLGLITGILINFFAECFIGFGQIISLQAGLGFATLYIPGIGNLTSLANFFFIISLIIFFQLNGHLIFIKMLINSFTHLPQINIFNPNLLEEILLYASIIFKGTVMLSIAVVFALMITNFTLALVTKFTAQLNLFSIGINIALILIFFMLYLSFDIIIENGEILCNDLLLFLKSVLK